MEKPPNLGECNGKWDLDKHVQLAYDQLNYFSVDEDSKWKLFALTLVGPTKIWFNGMSGRSIESWMNFYKRFSAYFITQKRHHVTVTNLSGIVQGKKESMRSYIGRFAQVTVEVEREEKGIKC